jgi:hypothetical protein
MLDRGPGHLGVRIERIGVIAKPTDLDSRLSHRVENLRGLGRSEADDIDVGHPSIPPLGLRHGS